jgi:hypothetical protein
VEDINASLLLLFKNAKTTVESFDLRSLEYGLRNSPRLGHELSSLGEEVIRAGQK